MVRITDGKSVFEVSSGAFKTIYEKQGFRLLEEADGSKAVAVQQDVATIVEEQHTADNELEEKPISQWTKTEVKEYAEQHGISLAGTKNVNEAKEVIKAAMSV